MCSATMMVVRLVTVEGTRGMLEASTTRRFCSPRTAPTESTTSAWSVAPPMGTVDVFGYPQKELLEVLPRQFMGRTEIPRGHGRLVDRFDDQDGQLGGVGQGSLVGVAAGLFAVFGPPADAFAAVCGASHEAAAESITARAGYWIR